MLTYCRAALIALPALAFGACSQTASLPVTEPPPGQITTGSVDRSVAKGPDTEAKVQSLTDASLTFMAAGPPVDVYVLVARGAMSCWFSPAGPLRRSHVFTADVDPPSRGGAALVTLHEKSQKPTDQRGARAFQVAMTTAPGGTQVAVATPKMAPEIAEAMKVDVQIWARGKPSCEVATLLAPTPTSAASTRPKAGSKPKR